jgi:DNA polymerase-1
MRHITYSDEPGYPIAIMIKSAAFNASELESTYTEFLEGNGIARKELVIGSLPYNAAGKAPVKFIKEQLQTLMVELYDAGVNYIYCADAAYFKVLAGQRKAEPHLGYVFDCKLAGFEHMKVMLGVNHKSLLYNPINEPKLQLSLDCLLNVYNGTHSLLGANIITYAVYPETHTEIQAFLDSLHQYPELTCDTETFSLKHYEAGLGTITFCWDNHEGGAFACDYATKPNPCKGAYGEYLVNPAVRKMIKQFLTTYTGKLTYHNATFDVKILIAALWMDHLGDTAGLLAGLEVLTRTCDDTKLISYVSLNSTGGNELSLKDLAHSYAGNWAQEDIKDIRAIPLNQLLKYNLVDGLCTWFVKNTYGPVMVSEGQEDIYNNFMLPSIKPIIQMELTGMPLDADEVKEAKRQLEVIVRHHQGIIIQDPIVIAFNKKVQIKAQTVANAKLKVKQHPLSAFAHLKFNPASNPQLQGLLYEEMKLPKIEYTATKQPATGGDVLIKLLNHTTSPSQNELLESIVALAKANKILTTFIPVFEAAVSKGGDTVWIFGNFNLGGTVSGRLSSSKPNLQTIPSGSTYGKLVKRCFQAPKGWLFGGADFTSLEDYISALTTRDPNKLKVYLDGYDGHCLRAYSYFSDLMPDIYQAEDTEECFKLIAGNETFYVKTGDVLSLPDGTKVLAENYQT